MVVVGGMLVVVVGGMLSRVRDANAQEWTKNIGY